ncbi:MAG: type VI secretion system tube protein Hcp [Planctomycetales bacterium]
MILMKFATEVKGESTVANHENWITVDSVQLGVGRSISQVGGGGDRETSNPSFSEVTFTKSTDVASAEIFMQAICGKTLGKAEIHFIQTGGTSAKGQAYLTLELDEAIVSSFSTSSAGERPTESFSLNITKISYKYDKFDGEKVTTGTAKKWSLEKNEVWS